MKKITWNPEKAVALQNDPTRRHVGFEECVVALESGGLLAIVDNPSQNHVGQKMYVVNIDNYAHCVPYVESENEVFLKTIFPSRKYTAIFIDGIKL
jgi:hypothetical protein